MYQIFLTLVSIGFALPQGLVGGASKAAQNVCRQTMNTPAVKLLVNPGKIVISNALSQNRLRRLQGTGTSVRRAKGWRPVGLTLTELNFNMNVRVNALPTTDNRYCGYPESVNANVGYDLLKIYVARKYHPKTCQYMSILQHEKAHVLVFRRLLDRYAPRIERRLTKVAHGIRPFNAATPQGAVTQIKEELQRAVQPLFRQFNLELDIANAKLDTPQNYRAEQARCSNW
ncbi:MAG: hypothetical protein CBB68_03170 [Rhodospirillaceae bacterium TMED8]|nr:hypothetical protein [Magnetovibrio sp.]OUT51893.1 MAG: hypothetical protein CBB68_03170 [Rhodospirillaceae bacterium TMED8]|tara:strand:+ start:480 stop:1166 length:687 start_codon:yes stop_codon:yes gene_type:complete